MIYRIEVALEVENAMDIGEQAVSGLVGDVLIEALPTVFTIRNVTSVKTETCKYCGIRLGGMNWNSEACSHNPSRPQENACNCGQKHHELWCACLR